MLIINFNTLEDERKSDIVPAFCFSALYQY